MPLFATPKRFQTVVFSLFAAVAACSQNLPQSFALANHLYETGSYAAAIEVYERVVFFDSNNRFRPMCYARVADAYRLQEMFDKALKYYDLAYHTAPNDSLKTEISFSKVLVLLTTQQSLKALEALLPRRSHLYGSQVRRYSFYIGISYFSDSRYDSAYSHFRALVANAPKDVRTQMELLIAQNERVERLNPNTAQLLSIFVPGLGQLYAGDIKNSLNSLLLVGGLGIGFLYMASTLSLLDAILALAPTVYRYYAGGYNHAKRIAIQKKAARHAAVYQKMLTVLAQ